jgi:hypothetical protein
MRPHHQSILQQCANLPFPVNIRLTDVVFATDLKGISRLYLGMGLAACSDPSLRRQLDDIAFDLINWHGRYRIRQVFFDICALPERNNSTCASAIDIIVLSFITVTRNTRQALARTFQTRRSMLPDDMRELILTMREEHTAFH